MPSIVVSQTFLNRNPHSPGVPDPAGLAASDVLPKPVLPSPLPGQAGAAGPAGRCRRHVDDSLCDREAEEFGAVAQASFAEHGGDVTVHGSPAEPEDGGGLLAGGVGGEHAEHLRLAFGEVNEIAAAA